VSGLEFETASGMAAAAIQAGRHDTGAPDEAPVEAAPVREPADVGQVADGQGFDAFDGDVDVADTVAQLEPELDVLGVPEHARAVVVEAAEQMFEQMIAAGIDESVAFAESLNIAAVAAGGAESEWASRESQRSQEDTFHAQGVEIARVAGVSRVNHADALESAATRFQNMSPDEIEGLGGGFRAATFAQVDAILEQKHGKLSARDRLELAPLRHSMVAALERQADAQRNPSGEPQPRDDHGRFASPRSPQAVLEKHFGPHATLTGGTR
jgi:hypothetical protein